MFKYKYEFTNEYLDLEDLTEYLSGISWSILRHDKNGNEVVAVTGTIREIEEFVYCRVCGELDDVYFEVRNDIEPAPTGLTTDAIRELYRQVGATRFLTIRQLSVQYITPEELSNIDDWLINEFNSVEATFDELTAFIVSPAAARLATALFDGEPGVGWELAAIPTTFVRNLRAKGDA